MFCMILRIQYLREVQTMWFFPMQSVKSEYITIKKTGPWTLAASRLRPTLGLSKYDYNMIYSLIHCIRKVMLNIKKLIRIVPDYLSLVNSFHTLNSWLYNACSMRSRQTLHCPICSMIDLLHKNHSLNIAICQTHDSIFDALTRHWR